MKKIPILGLFLVVVVSHPSRASAIEREVSGPVAHLASDLVVQYKAKRPGRTGESLAVLQLTTPDDPNPRIGRVVAGLLEDELDRWSQFEIRDLASSKKAVVAGIVKAAQPAWSFTASGREDELGTRLVAVVGVEPSGDAYEIEGNLVDLVAGEVIAASRQRVHRQSLDSEAHGGGSSGRSGSAWSLFVSMDYGSTAVVNHAPVTYAGTTAAGHFALTTTADLVRSPNAFVGWVGVGYKPAEWLSLEAAYTGSDAEKIRVQYFVPGWQAAACPPVDWLVSTMAVTAAAFWRGEVGRQTHGFVGLGGRIDDFSSPTFAWPGVTPIYGGSGAAEVRGLSYSANTLDSGITFSRLFLRGGVEWTPSHWLGLSASGTVFPARARYSLYYAEAHADPGESITSKESVFLKLMSFTLPRVLLEATISLSY